MSFKLGSGERVVGGQLFVDQNVKTLCSSLPPMPVKITETWISGDIRPSRSSERWLNAIAMNVPTSRAS